MSGKRRSSRGIFAPATTWRPRSGAGLDLRRSPRATSCAASPTRCTVVRPALAGTCTRAVPTGAKSRASASTVQVTAMPSGPVHLEVDARPCWSLTTL